jgi:hypothetical protein
MSKPPALSPVPYLPEGGKLGRAALGMMGAVPGYFRVPVEGLLDDDRLTLKILPAAQDYADRVVGMVAYVLWSPQVLIPQVKKFDVGYQGAHYILSRGTHTERGTSDEPFTLDVEVDAPNGVARIRRTFERREEEPGSYLLTWEIDLTACNPACRY